jgi:hypothetical protein
MPPPPPPPNHNHMISYVCLIFHFSLMSGDEIDLQIIHVLTQMSINWGFADVRESLSSLLWKISHIYNIYLFGFLRKRWRLLFTGLLSHIWAWFNAEEPFSLIILSRGNFFIFLFLRMWWSKAYERTVVSHDYVMVIWFCTTCGHHITKT